MITNWFGSGNGGVGSSTRAGIGFVCGVGGIGGIGGVGGGGSGVETYL